MENQQQSAGAVAPADEEFMTELLEGGQQDGAPQPQEEQRDKTQQEERPAAREPERIPLDTYLQEREKRQTLERRVAEFEAAERKKQEERAAPAWWEDPDAAHQHRVQSALSPIQQQLAEERQQRMDDRVFYSNERAVEKFGQDVVQKALQSLPDLKQNDPAEYDRLDRRITASRDPIGDVVRWHQQQATFREIGPDIDAYHQKLLANPEFLARAVEASRSLTGGQQQPRGNDGKFQAPKPASQRAPLPSMRAAGSAAAVPTRPSGNESGDDLLDEIFAAP